jgi:malto-oligosyltrehalose synthase/4-alpha-glucanotransferase
MKRSHLSLSRFIYINMFNPISTYRIQFHKDFRLADLSTIADYLKKLQIKTLYASPIFTAVPGSTHGYDGIDPSRINPEIGSEAELRQLSHTLKEAGIGWLQDIVPNHQAFDLQNQWLMDLLEFGQHSKFAHFFDVDWDHPQLKGKLMVATVSAPTEQLISEKELVVERKDDKFVLSVEGQLLPINKASLEKFLPSGDPESINGDVDTLQQLLNMQHYQLANWADTDHLINYRRFFTVNQLISLNIQHKDVFDEFHAKTLEFVRDKLFDGLRIDHIDGLYDPLEYLERLRIEAGEDTYIAVEKILQFKEPMPAWPVQGNTGYDFLAMVNNLFTLRKSAQYFRKKYAKFSDLHADPKVLRKEKKRAILSKHMAGDLDNLFGVFSSLDQGFTDTLNAQEKLQLKSIIAEILIDCPVYRYYPDNAADKQVREMIENSLKTLEKNSPVLQKMILQTRDMLLVRTQNLDEEYNRRALHFFRRLMQFTGPLTAKGVEDTLMYTYNALIAHNEVGDDVEAFGLSIQEFHDMMKLRNEVAPLSMNATATHDTKRGEDSRARLNVLSEIPERWFTAVKHWREINQEMLDSHNIHPNDEYFIYQVLIGAYPCMNDDEQTLVTRVQEYLVKALREAKLRSDWNKPDENYEENVKAFAAYLLVDDGPFRESFRKFLDEIMDAGLINSLSQVALKFTAPGVPDTYQGTELWDFSLVDPDNRRPVDYALRTSMLEEIENNLNAKSKLWDTRRDGAIKLFLTNRLMQIRAEQPALFEQGSYLPLKTKGKHSDSLLAFARNNGDQWLITVVPLFPLTLFGNRTYAEFDWKNTRVVLPETFPLSVRNLLHKSELSHNGELYARDILKEFPVAILKPEKKVSERGAGILLSITSLSSDYGAGDLGPAAYQFADNLQDASQKYWQLLPLNPVERSTDYAPYSSYSAMAGNTFLISPDLLCRDGLLSADDLAEFSTGHDRIADFEGAETARETLLQKAWENYIQQPFPDMQKAFGEFCETNSYWLQDHAYFVAIKNTSNGRSWTEWEDGLKERDKKALDAFEAENSGAIEKEKWLQFIFAAQFTSLKKYCNERQIKLIGDLPFYVSLDSADVWANRQHFQLDDVGLPLAVAGVPPDYFNEDGQLWGMPIFNWQELKKSGFTWWLNRIRRNLETVDLLRLDHFRAFAGYWSVPAGEETAKNGSWILGPGKELFAALHERFPQMPFIAEDLGEITPDVYELRDAYKLPGMRVLQFAFGDDLPISVNTPHNYTTNSIAYTGTHDNNTVKGWYRKDASKLNRKNLAHYTGNKVSEKNVPEIMTRMIYGSVSNLAIIPMQDILGLDETARMNTPAVSGKQWRWRMLPGEFHGKAVEHLRSLVRFYNRD